jgi:hypothetical protein
VWKFVCGCLLMCKVTEFMGPVNDGGLLVLYNDQEITIEIHHDIA